jgi:hypothetical protein
MIECFNLSDEIADKLSQAMQGNDDYFKDAIKSRVCQLWEFIPGTFVITRLEFNQNKERTVVVCCFEGKKVCLFTAKLIQFCINNRIEFIRFHTRIEKLGRVMKKKFLFNQIAETKKESVYLLRV